MSDHTRMTEDAEDLAAFRLAKKALVTMSMMLAPIIVVVGWLGYDKYSDLKAVYEESTQRLVEATSATKAQSDTLKALSESLRALVRGQTAELEYVSGENDRSRNRQEVFYSQLTLAAANDRADLRQSIERMTQLSTRVDESASKAEAAAQVASRAGPELSSLRQAVESTGQTAQQALTIAQEASVQTVGAGSRRQLYGTPFDIYFAGISRDAVRDFTIAYRDGATIKTTPRMPSTEVISIPVDDLTYQIAVVNVLDIPGGLLRLNGSSRADAATFRVTRIRTPVGPQARIPEE